MAFPFFSFSFFFLWFPWAARSPQGQHGGDRLSSFHLWDRQTNIMQESLSSFLLSPSSSSTGQKEKVEWKSRGSTQSQVDYLPITITCKMDSTWGRFI